MSLADRISKLEGVAHAKAHTSILYVDHAALNDRDALERLHAQLIASGKADPMRCTMFVAHPMTLAEWEPLVRRQQYELTNRE